MSRFWWRVTRALSWAAVRVYYRTFEVAGLGNLPAEGPVLLVVNHPNSLLDAAALLLAMPRPVRFGAKAPLFESRLWGPLLRALGAVAIHRRGDPGSDTGRNVEAFAKFVEALHAGEVCGIFPEGITHPDPELKYVKSGAARIALQAEEAAGGELGLALVPIGLTFQPEQAFRGEAAVRVGKPFGVADLLGRDTRETVPIIQERIARSLQPLMVHLEAVELAPLVKGVAAVYGEHLHSLPSKTRPPSRPEVLRGAANLLNHYLEIDPGAVEEVRRRYSVYERLSGRTGVPAHALRYEDRPFMAFLAAAAIGLQLVVGFPVFVFGMLTGYVPYRGTERLARHAAKSQGGAEVLPVIRLLAGLVLFGSLWGVLLWLMFRWSESATVTAAFGAALVLGGLFSLHYSRRARSMRRRMVALLPFFARRRAVRRVAAARASLLAFVNELIERYDDDGNEPLVPPELLRPRRRYTVARVAVVCLAGVVGWLAPGRVAPDVDALSDVPSPWADMTGDAATATLESDAARLATYLETLSELDRRLVVLKAGFDAGRRDFYDPADDAAIRRNLLTYLTCREGLFRLTWFYRDADAAGPGEHAPAAFLVAYASAVELAARGMQFVDTFADAPNAQRKLNEGDPAWDMPPGVYDRIRRNLASREVLDALAAATGRFERMRTTGALPEGDPWGEIAAAAARGASVVEALSERLGGYRWKAQMAQSEQRARSSWYALSSVVSTWIGDARVRKRGGSGDGGLISAEQVVWLRDRLRPGDILLERRNWYLSNAFLPGFWPHSAIYVGGMEGVESLGIAADPRVEPHLAALAQPDHGHRREVLEAISEGVVFTSLEESIGGADAVCVFRARLPPDRIAEAVARGIRHAGKPYDFDFDFFSTDKLVCTEVVYQAYTEDLDFELVEIMGRKTLPALEFVRKWDREKGTPDDRLEFVCFLDANEVDGFAFEADETALLTTLARPGLTLLREPEENPLFLSRPFLALCALLGVGLVAFRKTRAG